MSVVTDFHHCLIQSIQLEFSPSSGGWPPPTPGVSALPSVLKATEELSEFGVDKLWKLRPPGDLLFPIQERGSLSACTVTFVRERRPIPLDILDDD